MIKYYILVPIIVLLVIINTLWSIDATLKLRECKKYNVERYYE